MDDKTKTIVTGVATGATTGAVVAGLPGIIVGSILAAGAALLITKGDK